MKMSPCRTKCITNIRWLLFLSKMYYLRSIQVTYRILYHSLPFEDIFFNTNSHTVCPHRNYMKYNFIKPAGAVLLFNRCSANDCINFESASNLPWNEQVANIRIDFISPGRLSTTRDVDFFCLKNRSRLYRHRIDISPCQIQGGPHR